MSSEGAQLWEPVLHAGFLLPLSTLLFFPLQCKKKHTLVCPDFAKKGVCPRGTRCKLLHPQKKRHSREVDDGDRSDAPSKWRRVLEETGR